MHANAREAEIEGKWAEMLRKHAGPSALLQISVLQIEDSDTSA